MIQQMSGTKLVLCVALGVVLGGACLCGGVTFLMGLGSSRGAVDREQNAKLVKSPASARSDFETLIESSIKDGQTVTRYKVATGEWRIIEVPKEAYSLIWVSDRPGRILGAAGIGDLQLQPKLHTSCGVEDIPAAWTGKITIGLEGASSAEIAFVEDHR